MMTTLQTIWHQFWRNHSRSDSVQPDVADRPPVAALSDIDIAPTDPLMLYLQHSGDVVDLDQLSLESPAVRTLREAGIKLVVPLVSQGELIGLINLGPRLSEQEYSSEDRQLLNNLAVQAAPALRVAQLAYQQQQEARERERLTQELQVARLIQQTLLPQSVPQVEGWQVAAFYQPARAVGGDFYDFLYFPDGKVGFIIGDVTDKGVPAALVMATTRAILRAAAERLVAPGAVLERANEVLCPDIPPKMFVTCLYALLDPSTGRLRYANAGHDLPYQHTSGGVETLWARGMPLGLMPGMQYEEKETTLAPDDTVLFYSDGLVEAHDPQREMFGFPRLQELVARHPGGADLVPFLLDQLTAFTGPNWEQEDDVTLVTLQCEPRPTGDRTLAQFELPSEPGNERAAVEQVLAAVGELSLPAGRLEKLKTAVAEATMNAMEHGNQYQPEIPVEITVLARPGALVVRIADRGSYEPDANVEAPDLLAKLAGEQSPRGWGLFLIQNMVDELHTRNDDERHTIELVIFLPEGEAHAGKTEPV